MYSYLFLRCRATSDETPVKYILNHVYTGFTLLLRDVSFCSNSEPGSYFHIAICIVGCRRSCYRAVRSTFFLF